MNIFKTWGLMITISLFWGISGVQASTYYVEVWGNDANTCGKADPCRNLNAAVTLSVDGSRILVGPGLYGDVNDDGTLGNSPNEETPVSADYMIYVNKRLKIQSTNGAAATILAGGNNASTVVTIATSKVIFGGKGKGFTLRAAGSDGLEVEATANGVKIEGNRAIANGNGVDDGLGFYIKGGDTKLLHNIAEFNDSLGFEVVANSTSSKTILIGNLSRGNKDHGFVLNKGIFIVKGNAARNNGDGTGNPALGRGFFIGPDTRKGSQFVNNVAAFNNYGFIQEYVQGETEAVRYLRNLAMANVGSGFALDSPNKVVKGNIASSNGNSGFILAIAGEGQTDQIIGNSAISNGDEGMLIGDLVEPINDHSGILVKNNNLFGNADAHLDPTYNNCGIRNETGDDLVVANNWWGDTAGPGVDPADRACVSPDINMITGTLTTNYAGKPNKVKTKKGAIQLW